MTSSQFEKFIESRTELAGRIQHASRFLRKLDLWPYTVGLSARAVNARDIAYFFVALANPYDKEQFERTCNARDSQGEIFVRFLTKFIEKRELANSCILITISATNGAYGGHVFWEMNGIKVARSFLHDPTGAGESIILPGALLKEIHLLIHENEMAYN